MAENSKIEWCDHTVNLWWGCQKVHSGCKNCYAEYFSETRMNLGIWGGNAPRKLIKSAFADLDRYEKKAAKLGIKLKIFIGSMMDIFESSKILLNPTEKFNSTGDLRNELFNRIASGRYSNLVFLLLTKRPENIYYFSSSIRHNTELKNVWFGASISNQSHAAKITRDLRNSMAKNLFLSIEPQLTDLPHLSLTKIKWVIQGGESGVNKRPFQIEWAYKMKRKARRSSVAYFFKQIDKKEPIPEDLLVREFPDFEK